MTFSFPQRPARTPQKRRRGALAPTLAILAVVGVLLVLTAHFWTEWLWYDSAGYGQVVRTEWVTRSLLFAGGFLLMGAGAYVSIAIAYAKRPVYAPSTPEQASLDQYREMIEPLRRLVMLIGPAVLGLFAGFAASAQWQTVLLFVGRVPVGETDPQFGLDLSFYMFTLPAIRFVLSFLMAVAIVSGIAAVATQYLYGGLRLGGKGERTTRPARLQLGITGALLMLVIAANSWLDRYSLLTHVSGGDVAAGASYSDVNAVMPSKAILAAVAILVAIMFVVAAVRGTWRLPAIGVGLMVVSAVAIGGIYPAFVQRFQVDPNAQELEAEFIQHNIDATQAAFGLDERRGHAVQRDAPR